MGVIESIKSRKSVRRYQDIYLDSEILKGIKNDLENYIPKFGESKIRFQILKAEDEIEAAKLGFLWGIGKINAPHCIVGICQDDEGMQEIGFALEQEVLKLTSAGYGTCWLGTFDREALNLKCRIKGKEQIGIVIAFGVAQKEGFLNNNFRKIAGSTKRKDIKEIWMNYAEEKNNKKIAGLVEMSILAPSSNNKQPVRIIIRENRADFFLVEDSKINAGIFMAHFYLCASQISNDVNILIVREPFKCYNQRKEMDYVASILF